MNNYPPNPNYDEQRPPRKRRLGLRRLFRGLFLLIVCFAIAFVAVRFGPSLYRRFFGNGNTTWISQRFGEELKEKNELVVLETTITGEETAQQNAWLIGTVQEVSMPYVFSMSFVVDLSLADVSVNEAGDTIIVRLPSPVARYPKLTVDESKMKKSDLLYPLTPERYAEIKNEIEQRLTEESATKQENLDAAWKTAVRNMENLFKTIAERSEQGVTCDIQVIRDDRLANPTHAPAEETTQVEAADAA